MLLDFFGAILRTWRGRMERITSISIRWESRSINSTKETSGPLGTCGYRSETSAKQMVVVFEDSRRIGKDGIGEIYVSRNASSDPFGGGPHSNRNTRIRVTWIHTRLCFVSMAASIAESKKLDRKFAKSPLLAPDSFQDGRFWFYRCRQKRSQIFLKDAKY